MFCRKCGSELKDGAKFCTKCGAPVVPLNQGVKPEIKAPVAPEIKAPVAPEVKSDIEPDIELSAEPEVKPEIIPEVRKAQPELRKSPKHKTVNNKPDKKTTRDDNNRMLTIIMIIVLVVAILVASAAAIYLLKPEWLGLGDSEEKTQVIVDSEEDEEEDEEGEEESEEGKEGSDTTIAEETPVTEAPAAEEVAEPEEEEIVFEDWDLDIEAECTSIKSMVSDYESCLGNYKKYTLEDGNIIAYVQEGIPVKVIVKKGYKNWNYSREYYGVDSFYTKIYDDMGTRELFYSGSKLCRIIDENGTTYDYNSENWAEYNELAEKADKDKSEIKQFIRDNI